MNDEANTRPTLETVLQRINSLSDQLNNRLNSIEHELSELRAETNEHFLALESKFDILSEDVIEMRGKVRRVEKRMDRLESNPS